MVAEHRFSLPQRFLVRVCAWLLWAMVFVLLLWAGPGWAATTNQWVVGTTITTLLSTELNNIGNNAYTGISATTYDNRISGTTTGAGYTLCRVEGNFTFTPSPPTANTAISLWFLKTIDGVNFENTPTASISLGRPPDVVLPVTTGQTGTRVSVDIRCPAERSKGVVKNDGTGQSLAASGNTIRILPITQQGN